MAVAVAVQVDVAVGVAVEVDVGVDVAVFVGVAVGVQVGVEVGVQVGVELGVQVGVQVGVWVWGVCVMGCWACAAAAWRKIVAAIKGIRSRDTVILLVGGRGDLAAQSVTHADATSSGSADPPLILTTRVRPVMRGQAESVPEWRAARRLPLRGPVDEGRNGFKMLF